MSDGCALAMGRLLHFARGLPDVAIFLTVTHIWQRLKTKEGETRH